MESFNSNNTISANSNINVDINVKFLGSDLNIKVKSTESQQNLSFDGKCTAFFKRRIFLQLFVAISLEWDMLET